MFKRLIRFIRLLLDYDHEKCYKKQVKMSCKGKTGILGYMPSSYEIIKCTNCRYYINNYIEEIK